MLANFHTHSVFCDGENTPEEIVRYAIDRKFDAIGFSGHGYTEFDLSYCMKDTEGYIESVNMLKDKYKAKIKIYLGVEEDSLSQVDRGLFDYIIGSSHYLQVCGKYYPIDISYDSLQNCIEAFGGDKIKLAEAYYSDFCRYIMLRKPDIVGHFDLITKFDELSPIFLYDDRYLKVADKYIEEALKEDIIFEVNTGAISRGLRTTPYPHERLLFSIYKHGGKIILSSDSHSVNTLDFYFEETKKMLRDIGFKYVYSFCDNAFVKYGI